MTAVAGLAAAEPSGMPEAAPSAAPSGLAQPPAQTEPTASPATQPTPAPPSAPPGSDSLAASDWETRPDTLEYDPNRPVVPGYAVERYYPRGYIIAGSITFGIGYGLGFLAALGNSDMDFEAKWLLLPIAGPFIGMATQHDTCEVGMTPTNCGRATSTLVVLAALGTMQVVGAGLFTLGLTQPRLRQVRVDTPQFTLAPIPLGRRGYGLGATGTF